MLFFFGYRNTFYKECMKEVSKMIIKENYAVLLQWIVLVPMIEKWQSSTSFDEYQFQVEQNVFEFKKAKAAWRYLLTIWQIGIIKSFHYKSVKVRTWWACLQRCILTAPTPWQITKWSPKQEAFSVESWDVFLSDWWRKLKYQPLSELQKGSMVFFSLP